MVEELGISKQTFSRVMSIPRISQRIQPIPSLNFNLVLTISPNTLSYTSNQPHVIDAAIRTPTPLD